MQNSTRAKKKKNRHTIGTVEGHNARLHDTQSQIPDRSAWFTPEGAHTLIAYNSDLVKTVKGLAKRKDAVLGIELILSAGDQAQWRDEPNEEFRYGEPLPDFQERLMALQESAKAVAEKIGLDKIIGMHLHTDESTPHVHLVFAPIVEDIKPGLEAGAKEEKVKNLRARDWVGGFLKCAEFREAVHFEFNKYTPCVYEKGAYGGEKHDPRKAAGGIKARVPALPEPTLLERTKDKLTGTGLLKQLIEENEKLNRKAQISFSQKKKLALDHEKELKKIKEEAKKELAEVQKSANEKIETHRKNEVIAVSRGLKAYELLEKSKGEVKELQERNKVLSEQITVLTKEIEAQHAREAEAKLPPAERMRRQLEAAIEHRNPDRGFRPGG